MPKRLNRIKIAKETLQILRQGHYLHPSGKRIDLAEAQQKAKDGTKAWLPEELADLVTQAHEVPSNDQATQFEVENETTFHAAKRLYEAGYGPVCALNFASARNPGGGFLNGSQAQEESLARASGLYHCIVHQEAHYQHHRKHRSGLYTDRMIYSPGVPVFRDDEDKLLEDWYPVSIITSAAVNLGSLKQNRPHEIPLAPEVMRKRAAKVLALALHHAHPTLVLGAWGCGVFQQNPVDMAGYFAELLLGEGPFVNCFERVVFAVLDRRGKDYFIGPFRERFA
jgi:uncharacterized protein (TIGR02452 family)